MYALIGEAVGFRNAPYLSAVSGLRGSSHLLDGILLSCDHSAEHRRELHVVGWNTVFDNRFLQLVHEGLDPANLHAFGFDFARVADLTVGKLLAIDKLLKRRSALTFELRRVPGEEQKQITKKVLKGAPRLVGAAFDATGMGWTVAEDMGREFGLWDATHNPAGMVRAIHLSEAWYRTEMPPLKVRFEDDAIALAPDPEHLADLRLVKIIRGTPRVPDVRTGEAGKRRHGDFAIALALADYASRQQWHEFGYVAVAPSGSTGSARRDFDQAPGDYDFAECDPYRSPLGAGIRGGTW